MTTLERAAEVGTLTEQQVLNVLKDHDLSYEEAHSDLGELIKDAVTLCEWIGY